MTDQGEDVPEDVPENVPENTAQPRGGRNGAGSGGGEGAGSGGQGTGRRRWYRRRAARRTAVTVLALALVAASGLVLYEVARGDDCWRPPKATARLAQDPARATRALDPGAGYVADAQLPGGAEKNASPDALTALLSDSHWHTCHGPSGPRLIGDILTAATTGRTADDRTSPARRHTAPMARTLHRAVNLLGGRSEGGHNEVTYPAEFRPYAARLLASWPDSVNSGVTNLPRKALTTDRQTGETHVGFGAHNFDNAQLEAVVLDLAADPRSYAILYDALRARAADRLDPLRRDQAFPPGVREAGHDRESDQREDGSGDKQGDEHGDADEDRDGREEPSVTGELFGSAAGMAALAHARDQHVARGDIPDGTAFDRAVVRHSAGGYAPTARPEGTRHAFEGAAALRKPSAKAADWARSASGSAVADDTRRSVAWFMDYEQQLRRTADLWITRRHLPAPVADRLRGALDRAHDLQIDLQYATGPRLDH
ncbi:hypothetical protein [Streptomyces cacaoi]|uniref:hypothetical protein n=1 Tax=Streptomyces cacaoi TaxID=1898 RepID=UPI0011F25BB9|nr:hypothetical protein [Streptomyces cacaoi]